jgi:hypothetical protein
LVLDLPRTRERPVDLPHFPIIRTPPLVWLFPPAPHEDSLGCLGITESQGVASPQD